MLIKEMMHFYKFGKERFRINQSASIISLFVNVNEIG